MSDAENLERQRVLVALAALPRRVLGDVLADGTIQSKFGISGARPMPLSDKATVAQEQLFAAFAEAAAGATPTVSVRYEGKPLDCSLWIEADATAVLQLPQLRVRFAFAGLLAQDRERRLEFLATILATHTLTQSGVAELSRRIGVDPFEYGAFLLVSERLNSTPEAFERGLSELLAKRTEVSESDLLPDDVWHWDNLTAEPERSQTLAQFVDDELIFERMARLKADARAFSSMALTFGSPELVPKEWIRGLDVDAVIRGVQGLVAADDHFSLVGSFEICADLVGSDNRFVALGEQLLDRLFANPDNLVRQCQTFATAFVLATARLALHSRTRERPAYWRRLAAVAHAGLVVRIVSASTMEREGLLLWALQLRGVEYQISTHLDMSTEPQWRPEWLDPNILAADVFGRANGAARLLSPDVLPPSWEERLSAATRWIEGQRLLFQSQFSAVLQSARRTRHPIPDGDLQKRVDSDYRTLEEEPTAENLVALTPWIEALALPETASVGIHKFLEQTRKGMDRSDPKLIQAALSLAAHVAVLSKNVPLADAVADAYLHRLRALTGELPVFDAVLRITECAAANPNRGEAREMLSTLLERLAFSLPTGTASAELEAALGVLQSLDPELEALLGRATHTARLAAAAPPIT